jgi:hypothetical protein
MWKRRLVEDITFGLAQEVMLRQRYQQEDFGLESAFGSEREARARITDLKRNYGLSEADIRLVQNISKVGGGERITWQVYAKAGKGANVFLPKSSKEKET